MKKLLLTSLFLIPILSVAGLSVASNNIPKAFDTRPVIPTVNKLRNESWTWQNFATLLNVDKLQRDVQNKNRYLMTQTVNEENPNTTITFYGTKERPEVAVIESRTWGAANTQDSRFVRLDMLKGNLPLKSNCNFRDVSISESGDDDGFYYESGATLDFQQAYTLPKNISSLAAGKNNLYVASSQVETYVITGSFQTQAYTLSIISPDKSKLGQFMTTYGWNTNKNGKEVRCSVS